MPKRPIFEDKDPDTRFQGILTKTGGVKWAAAKKRLAAIYREVVGQPFGSISDGDVAEFLARGEANTRAYLKETKCP